MALTLLHSSERKVQRSVQGELLPVPCVFILCRVAHPVWITCPARFLFLAQRMLRPIGYVYPHIRLSSSQLLHFSFRIKLVRLFYLKKDHLGPPNFFSLFFIRNINLEKYDFQVRWWSKPTGLGRVLGVSKEHGYHNDRHSGCIRGEYTRGTSP